jgi:hypothetical protein
LDKVRKPKITNKSKENGSENREILHQQRCINIDCAFNSSLDVTQERNLCNHPNLRVSSNLAEITIAICSEFRYKKDYKFKKPNTLIDLKTRSVVEIPDNSDPEIISTESLESEAEAAKKIRDKETAGAVTPVLPQRKHKKSEEPVIVMTEDDTGRVKSPSEVSEFYKLTDDKSSNFFILNRLYQPYMKRGVIFSVIFHLIFIWLFYVVFANRENESEIPSEQRIVVVEDIETPKFIPPDMDKKEEPANEDKGEVKTPRIIPKRISPPKIIRPKTFTDTTSVVNKDTTKGSLLDTSLASLYKGDTSRFIFPDSLKSTFADNEVGMSLWYPKNWKLRDSRELNKGEQFSGVIINTDSLSEDPGAVTMFILLENDKVNSFNKTVFKTPFPMEDSMSTAFSTDPMQTGAKKITYKFYIFAPTNKIFVNTEAKQEFFEKYKKYIEAIVRSIKIVKKEPPKLP